MTNTPVERAATETLIVEILEALKIARQWMPTQPLEPGAKLEVEFVDAVIAKTFSSTS